MVKINPNFTYEIDKIETHSQVSKLGTRDSDNKVCSNMLLVIKLTKNYLCTHDGSSEYHKVNMKSEFYPETTVTHTVRKLKESYKGMLKVELITTQKRAYYRVDLKKKRFFLQTVFLAK